MGILRKSYVLAGASAIFAVAGASAQTSYDPYNPQTRRQSPSLVSTTGTPTNNIQPSIIDMGAGTDQGNIGPFVTIPDKQFAQITAVRALMQLQLGRRALATTQRADVKDVAQLMVRDYTRWGDGMQKAAAYLKIQVPTQLDEKHQAEVDRIIALSGDEFDKAYLAEVIHLQNKALAVTQYEAANAGVTGFRHWSGVMVPKIQDEVQVARRTLRGETIVSKR